MGISLLTGIGTTCADAATLAAVETTNGSSANWRNTIGANQSATVGWSFQVGALDLQVDALGIYDPAVTGLEDSHPVGIWTSGGTLLAQVTVPSGTAGTLVGGYSYEPITAITLTAGSTYIVGTYFAPVADLCGSACGDTLLYNGTETYAPGITFLQSRQTAAVLGPGSLALPNLNAGIAEGLFGPNLLLNAPAGTAAPAPSTWGLAGFRLLALVAGGRRRSS